MRWIIGSDENDIKFVGKSGTFIARIGVAVGIPYKRYRSFVYSYLEFMEQFKRRFDLSTPRRVFASTDIKRHLIGPNDDPTEYMLFMKDFVENVITPNDIFTNFVFSSFGTKKIHLPNGIVGVMKFIKNILKSYFAYVPAWIVVSRINSRNMRVYIDNFNTSPVTLAWNNLLAKSAEVKVFPSGDKINPIVSSADLLLGYIKTAIELSRWKLDVKTLMIQLPSLGFSNDLLRVYHVGSKFLRDIVPIDLDTKIFPHHFYPHPIIYILPENILRGTELKEKTLIENSLAYEYILRYAEEKDTSVKFLSLQSGSGGDIEQLAKTGGIIVSLGPKGKELGAYLEYGLNFPIHHIHISELISEYGGD